MQDKLEKLKELEEKIGYHFQDKTMLRHAMVHSSFANEHRLGKTSSNERLEFLGDAVLEVVTSEFLFHKYPDMPEGDMTKLRASTVCEPTLAYCAAVIPLGEYLLLGKGEDATGGRERDSVVSDAFEALIGAIYLDGGFANAKEFIIRFVLDDLEHKKLFYDSKTILQEIVQSRLGQSLTYELIREEGPDHNKSFEVCVKVGDVVLGEGRGRTKKSAEQVAAYHGILKLGEKQE
ncbi:MAG: ribonuclease III [bacterium]|nr:ribonuclease III [bacterium]